MPALLKGWVDRVFVPGFAYNMKGFFSVKHLSGRTATLITTSQAPTWASLFIGNSTRRLVKRAVLGLCGIKTVQSLALGFLGTNRDSSAAREGFLEKARAAAANLS
jgi:putative NADPH-quinone reductase